MADEQITDRFAVLAETNTHGKPLFLVDLSFPRLMDDVVVPYQSGQPFFIDGAPVKPNDLKRIKILRTKPGLDHALTYFHRMLSHGEIQARKLYGDQYHIRVEAILREHGEDVTSQVIKAFDNAIKPRLKDYLPNRQELIGAAIKVFVEGMKALGAG